MGTTISAKLITAACLLDGKRSVSTRYCSCMYSRHAILSCETLPASAVCWSSFCAMLCSMSALTSCKAWANAYSNKRCRLACYTWRVTQHCRLSAQVGTERGVGEHLRCLTRSLVRLLSCQMALQYNRIALHNIGWHRCVTCNGACWHWHTTISMSTASRKDCHKANQWMKHGPNASCNCAQRMDMQAPALPIGFDAS